MAVSGSEQLIGIQWDEHEGYIEIDFHDNDALRESALRCAVELLAKRSDLDVQEVVDEMVSALSSTSRMLIRCSHFAVDINSRHGYHRCSIIDERYVKLYE